MPILLILFSTVHNFEILGSEYYNKVKTFSRETNFASGLVKRGIDFIKQSMVKKNLGRDASMNSILGMFIIIEKPSAKKIMDITYDIFFLI
jgi:hypothetical protein